MSTLKLLAASPFLLLRLLIALALLVGVLLVIVLGLAYVTLSLVKYMTGILTGFKKGSVQTTNNTKHVIVTGGSSGIGLEVARIYLQKGYRVTIVARNQTKLLEAKEDLKKTYPIPSRFEENFQFVSVDVGSSEEAVALALSPAITKFGDVDIIVNSAGTSVAGTFDTLDSKDFERMYRVNVLGSVYPTRVVLPAMKLRKQGKIIFVSSQVAQAAIYGYTAYGASKWALRGLAEALQMELKPFNITVSVAYPPDTDTPGYQEEMLSKPLITKKISETGSVFSAFAVAEGIVNDADNNYFAIAAGSDGWLLKQLHPGMTPLNNVFEVAQQVVFSSILRLVAVVYLSYWDYLVSYYHREGEAVKSSTEAKKKD